MFRLKPGDILLINPGELHKPLTLKEDGPYERIVLWINKAYLHSVSEGALAARFFVSKYYLSHEFSRAVGTGIHRYITLKRLYIAYDLLPQKVPAGEVRTLCGFRDYTNFFRAFKAEYGISPREVL